MRRRQTLENRLGLGLVQHPGNDPVFKPALSHGHLDEHHPAHHVVQKGIRSNLKGQIAAVLLPGRLPDRANGTAPGAGRRAKSSEIVRAREFPGAGLQAVEIWGRPHPPGVALCQRAPGRVAEDLIAVGAFERIKAGVEIRQSSRDPAGSHIRGEGGVERPQQGIQGVIPIQIKGGHLPGGMYPAVGASGQLDGRSLPA